MVIYTIPLQTFAQSPYFISIHTGGHVFESNRNIGDTFLLGLGLGYQFNNRLSAAVRMYTGKYDIQYLKDNIAAPLITTEATFIMQICIIAFFLAG